MQFDITNEAAIIDLVGNSLVSFPPQDIANVVIDTTVNNNGVGIIGLSLFGEQSLTNTNTSTSTSESIVAPVEYQTIIKGTDSPQIRIFQQQLNEQGYTVALTGPGSSGQETTYFGDQTEQAVLKFQAANNLLQTGVFDHDTQVALLNGSERVMLIKSIVEQIANIQARIQEIIFQQQTEESYNTAFAEGRLLQETEE